jgi:hypothetical protein
MKYGSIDNKQKEGKDIVWIKIRPLINKTIDIAQNVAQHKQHKSMFLQESEYRILGDYLKKLIQSCTLNFFRRRARKTFPE